MIRATRLGLLAALGACFAAVAGAQAPVAADPAAQAVVADLHAGFVAAAERGLDLTQRFEALRPLVADTHDLDYIAQLTVRRQWDTLTDEQRRRFVAAFERLSVMTYASRFANVTAETFALRGSEPAGGGRVAVRAAIRRVDAADVSLDYQLHETPDGWRIVNILADGVSDLALKRAEYQRILNAGSIDDVIATLEAQTASLE